MSNMHINLFMWHMEGIFVAGPYMGITCEVDVAVVYAFTHICRMWDLYAHVA